MYSSKVGEAIKNREVVRLFLDYQKRSAPFKESETPERFAEVYADLLINLRDMGYTIRESHKIISLLEIASEF